MSGLLLFRAILRSVTMEKRFISIIVPIYNAEQYLVECIDSLIKQSLKNIEIILINDGSIDSSSEICKMYAAKDSRIRYYETPNGGVSNARNVGISYAIADWITFVDSDDWVSPDYCQKLASYIDDKVDFIIGRTLSVEDGKIMDDSFQGQDVTYFMTDEEKYILYEAVINDNPKVRRYPHLATCSAKLFRKRVIDNNHILYSKELKYYEDALFNMEAIVCSKSVCVVSDILYFYRTHNNSSTQTFSNNTILFYEKAFNELLSFSKKNNLMLEKDYCCFNIKNLNTILSNYFKGIDTWNAQYNFVKKVCNRRIFHDSIRKVRLFSVPYRRRILLVFFARIRMYALIVCLYNRN